MQISVDKDGILRVVNEKFQIIYDRVSGVSVAGWSDQVARKSQYKTCDETTGKITSKH